MIKSFVIEKIREHLTFSMYNDKFATKVKMIAILCVVTARVTLLS